MCPNCNSEQIQVHCLLRGCNWWRCDKCRCLWDGETGRKFQFGGTFKFGEGSKEIDYPPNHPEYKRR